MDVNVKEKDLSYLDEDRPSARQSGRQEFLLKWCYAIALAPFSVVVLVGLELFADSTSRVFDVFVTASLIWAIGIAIYTFYLLFFWKCPRCGWRFGSGPECCSCKLPRHRDYTRVDL
jgi:hypothetical protein